MPKLFYLASPYSHEDPAVREERFNAICNVAGRLMRGGIHVWSPIAHSHPIALEVDLPKDFAFWRAHNFETLRRCDGMLICKMPGWDKSIGVAGEIEEGDRLGLWLHYMDWPNFDQWLERKRGVLV